MAIFSSTALDDLLADNTVGAISEKDLRDFKDSVFVSQFSGAGVRLASNYSIPSAATFTAIPWDTEDYDTDGYWAVSPNATRLTAPVAGYYRISAAVHLQTTASVDSIGGIHINGSGANSVGETFGRGESGSGFIHFNGSYTLSMAASDYVEIIVYVNGATRTARAGARAWIERVGQTPA